MIRLIKDTMNFITRYLRSLILFELLYVSLFIVGIVPFFEWVMKKALRISRYSYVTIENIVFFLRSPITILALILVMCILAFYILIQLNCLSVYLHNCMQVRRIRVIELIFTGIVHTTRQIKSKQIFLAFYSLLYGVVIFIPYIFLTVTNMRIPSYMLKQLMKDKSIVIGILVVMLILVALVFGGLFVFQYCNIEDKKFKESYRLSKRLRKEHQPQIIALVVVWNVILWISYIILYATVALITGMIIYFTMNEGVVVVAFLKTYEQMNRYIGYVIVTVTLVANYGLITKLYITYRKLNPYAGYEIDKIQEKMIDSQSERLLEQRRFQKIKVPQGRYTFIITALIVFVVFLNSYYLLSGVNKGTFNRKDTLFGTYITSHRGASSAAPENTLPAIQLAIDQFADYVEIDVQETKDGVVVLFHDASLKRTTGVKKNIWNVTYEELRGYDAGSWFSKEYASTYVPTLEEVLQLCKGKIKLNIELKINAREQYLAEKVVDLLEEYGFVEECVISSTSYSALARVKEVNQEIKTGHIMSIAYGYFYNNEYADFFSVKSSFISESMVRIAHSLGKEVHAWTVNNTTEVERMKQLGVDNIITDDAVKVRELVSNGSVVTTFKELLSLLVKGN